MNMTKQDNSLRRFSFAISVLVLLVAGCTSSRHATQIQQAIAVLDSSDRVERSNAASTLRQFGIESIPQLMHTAQTDTGRKRSKAIFILGQIGAPSICPQFEDLLKRDDPPLPVIDRAIIVDILGEIGGETYRTLFISMLHSETAPDVKYALANRLSALGDESGTIYLTQHWVRVLETQTDRRQKLAAMALKKLHGVDFGIDVVRWRKWLKEEKGATQHQPP